MDATEALLLLLSGIVGLALCVLFGFLIFYVMKFIIAVPRHLKDIADSLDKIATEKGEH